MAGTIPGAGITTPLTLTEDGNLDTLIIRSTDADASAGPLFVLDRASGSPADGDLIGRILYRSRNDAGEAIDLVKTSCFIVDASDGTEDTQFEIDQRIAGTYRNMLTTSATQIIFNEDAQDIDFRVETNGGGANALFLEGGSKTNGMFVSTADLGAFNELSNHVAGHFINGDGSAGNAGITIFTGSSNNGHLSFADGTSGTAEYKGLIQYQHNGDRMILYTNAADQFIIASNGDLTATDTSIGAKSSDQRLKENIQDYTYDVSKFKTMKPRSYDWKFPDAHKNEPTVGFVAQELETVDSDWVMTQDFVENTIKLANFDDEKALLTDGKKKTVKFGKKDAMYISVIQQLITRIEALEG